MQCERGGARACRQGRILANGVFICSTKDTAVHTTNAQTTFGENSAIGRDLLETLQESKRYPHLRTIVYNIYSASLDGRLVGDLTPHGAIVELVFGELICPHAAPGLATKAERGGTFSTPVNQRKYRYM